MNGVGAFVVAVENIDSAKLSKLLIKLLSGSTMNLKQTKQQQKPKCKKKRTNCDLYGFFSLFGWEKSHGKVLSTRQPQINVFTKLEQITCTERNYTEPEKLNGFRVASKAIWTTVSFGNVFRFLLEFIGLFNGTIHEKLAWDNAKMLSNLKSLHGL